jgi:carbon-monoxide dehydrogenase large subunit
LRGLFGGGATNFLQNNPMQSRILPTDAPEYGIIVRICFDREGPLAVNYADYLLPTADTIPIEIHHMEWPTPLNTLGVEGAAESRTIDAPAAIAAAIEDALSPLGVVIRDLPVTPTRLRALIAAADARA